MVERWGSKCRKDWITSGIVDRCSRSISDIARKDTLGVHSALLDLPESHYLAYSETARRSSER